MAEQSIRNLIDDLSEDWSFVTALRHPVVRLLPWLVFMILYITGVINFLGIRYDIGTKLSETTFVYEIGLVFSIAVSAALVTGWLAIPDLRGQKWIVALPLTLLAVFLFWVGTRTYSEGFSMPSIEWNHCARDALLLGFVPSSVLIFLSRCGATTKPFLTFFMVIISASAWGWLGLRITCPLDMIGHSFFYHFLPFAVIGVLSGMLARKIYHW